MKISVRVLSKKLKETEVPEDKVPIRHDSSPVNRGIQRSRQLACAPCRTLRTAVPGCILPLRARLRAEMCTLGSGRGDALARGAAPSRSETVFT